MRRPNLGRVVTPRTRIEGALLRTKLHAPMLGMTINTTDARSRVRLDRRRDECVRVMTSGATLFHAPRQRMTARTRTRVRLRRDRRCQCELLLGVRFRKRPRSKRTRETVRDRKSVV